jgi:hypothetical protein
MKYKFRKFYKIKGYWKIILKYKLKVIKKVLKDEASLNDIE